ncbi:hypothetical protein [Nocardia sp. bgisy118]|uniref:hypothetical protein n=1 Tax=Nocardia sp. bgisy118 TaxID=3413786 RepID=UPI003F4A1054
MLLLPVGAAAVALRFEFAGEPSADARTRGRDAVWLGHAWVDGRKTDTDVAGLVTTLAGTGIKDLYVHTGPLEHNGSLRGELHPRAQWFVDAVHRALPGIRVQSWLGDVVAPEFDVCIWTKPPSATASPPPPPGLSTSVSTVSTSIWSRCGRARPAT